VIELASGARCAEHDAYVDGHQGGATCYHLSLWTDVVARAYRVRTLRVVSRAASGARIRGVLPLYVVPRPFGRYVTTGPFGAYGPLLADDDAAAHELLDAARGVTERAGAGYLHIKALGDRPAPRGFGRQDVWVVARLPLDGGAAAVWSRMRKGARAAVKQAGRNGFSLHRGRAELHGFYDVLADNMHRKGAPIYGLDFFRGLLDAFGDRADVVTLHEDGRAVSGALTISYRGVLYVPFASSRAAYFPKRPNNLLYWSIVEHACKGSAQVLDFGSSMKESSSLAFKRHFAARVEPVASYVYDVRRGGDGEAPPELGPRAAAVQAGVRVLQALPRGVCDALGPWLCRFML
jgi:FemAB-related protein (PEP-CTERM system-associated)